MLTHNLGYPRIGSRRELKKACKRYWASQIELKELLEIGEGIRQYNWRLQQEAGVDLIPCNDFSFYDQALDLSLMVGAIPARYAPLYDRLETDPLDLYFAMARGYQKGGLDIIAMEMTKWFDTNYHYIVPEFTRDQTFSLTSRKAVSEFQETKDLGIQAKPVLLGPISYLLLGKEKEAGFHRLELLDRLLPVYLETLEELQQCGAEYVQLDEPLLALDLSEQAAMAFEKVYEAIARACPQLKIVLGTYFAGLGANLELAARAPVHMLHLDLVRAPEQLEPVLSLIPPHLHLSLGVVDGRNIWKNDLDQSLAIIDRAMEKLGPERLALAPSCSLLHVPYDLALENNQGPLPGRIKCWLAFARQKLDEIVTLRGLAQPETRNLFAYKLRENRLDMESRRQSPLIHNPAVKAQLAAIKPDDLKRQSVFEVRQQKQRAAFHLPPFPTTTIGSLPQTSEIRRLRLKLRKGEITEGQYDAAIRVETESAVRFQEEIGLDVLVHGEFERNDMVEYFGERLAGFVFTGNGWVQSYGSRCVKPPIIFGDVNRTQPMTIKWSQYAQSLTEKPVKGMLTGPVTMLQWSFVRNDQPRDITAKQIALALRAEARDLEQAGIRIIQIDEPAIREGLPLRRSEWAEYVRWAVESFRLASSGVTDITQIHTHMCYSEFNDMIESIAALDADVITLEASGSQMELLDAFAEFRYPNEIGPGVYDIHSPRVPTTQEMVRLLQKALAVLPAGNLWVNPDCGLKTRGWPETMAALVNMVAAASKLRGK